VPCLPWRGVEVPALSPGDGDRHPDARRGGACAAYVPGMRWHRPEGVNQVRAAGLPQAHDQERANSRTFPGHPRQVRGARAFAAGMLNGCPASQDAILCVSEFSANAVSHSRSGDSGGRFTVRVELFPDDYVWVEVEDEGGPWERQADSMPGHGLDIVAKIASEWGVDGCVRGWILWARLDWSGHEE